MGKSDGRSRTSTSMSLRSPYVLVLCLALFGLACPPAVTPCANIDDDFIAMTAWDITFLNDGGDLGLLATGDKWFFRPDGTMSAHDSRGEYIVASYEIPDCGLQAATTPEEVAPGMFIWHEYQLTFPNNKYSFDGIWIVYVDRRQIGGALESTVRYVHGKFINQFPSDS